MKHILRTMHFYHVSSGFPDS